MVAVVISIGDELVCGLTINTNAAWLSQQLAAVGIHVQAHLTVGDDMPTIIQTIRAAIGSCDLILISGGLGPTEDDLTREALARTLDEELVEDSQARAGLEAFFQRLNRPMVASNLVQARRPVSARCVENTCGTAPGLVARFDSTDIFVMPGVPREMKEMFDREFLPLLKKRSGGNVTRVLKLNTFGAGESWIGQRLGDLMKRTNQPAIGTTVQEGIVAVRIYATGPLDTVDSMLAEARRAVLERLGNLIFSEHDITLEQVVAELLKRRRHTLAVAESCTGGLLTQMLTSIAGSSVYFLRGWITYSNAAKIEDLCVAADLIARHGAVSGQVAQAMADNARRKAGADWGIGITGIAGPDGGTADKPVGLVYIAMAGTDGITVRRCQFAGDRYGVRVRAAQMALTLLRFKLLGLNADVVLP